MGESHNLTEEFEPIEIAFQPMIVTPDPQRHSSQQRQIIEWEEARGRNPPLERFDGHGRNPICLLLEAAS